MLVLLAMTDPNKPASDEEFTLSVSMVDGNLFDKLSKIGTM